MSDDLQEIRDEVQERIDSARELISDAALDEEWEKAKAIAERVKALESVQKQAVQLKKDFRKAIKDFDELTKIHHKSPHTKLQISIDWRAAGVDCQSDFLDGDQAAETLTTFLERIADVLGADKLEAIAHIPIGRSGLVSRNPRSDFVNPSTGEEYANRPVGSTGWYVKTHSSTKQKQDLISQVRTVLGLPRHAIEVDVVEK